MRRMPLVVGCAIALMAPAGAWAAGGPVPAVQGGVGISAPGDATSFVAIGVGDRTLVEQVAQRGGAVRRTLTLRGRYGIPGVAYDGSTTGLSADGRTLVLAEVLDRFPVTRTRLVAVRDPRRLRGIRRITLPGFYTVDAIAPSGDWLYLIRYLKQDGRRYEVRAYDVVRHRLAPAPVVDPREPDEKMQGFPLTRAMSADGRWAYTVYTRPDGEPFIHALDTARRAAACIDLPTLAGSDLSTARLVPPHGTQPLLVRTGAAPPLAVDVAGRTAAPLPAPPRRAAPAPAAPEPSSALPTWVLGLVASAVGIGAALLVAARRRRRPPRSPPA